MPLSTLLHKLDNMCTNQVSNDRHSGFSRLSAHLPAAAKRSMHPSHLSVSHQKSSMPSCTYIYCCSTHSVLEKYFADLFPRRFLFSGCVHAAAVTAGWSLLLLTSLGRCHQLSSRQLAIFISRMYHSFWHTSPLSYIVRRTLSRSVSDRQKTAVMRSSLWGCARPSFGEATAGGLDHVFSCVAVRIP